MLLFAIWYLFCHKFVYSVYLLMGSFTVIINCVFPLITHCACPLFECSNFKYFRALVEFSEQWTDRFLI